MSILTEVLYFLFSDIRSAIITLLIGLIVYKLSKFYAKVFTLPPGPIPLPLLGNVLLFRTKNHWDFEIKKITKNYGPVTTIWMGNNPLIFITDIDLAREVFRKNEFSGRPDSFIASKISTEEHRDIVFTDYGHTWEALRRVAHSAVQKYSTNDRLVYLASDCVDRTVKMMIDREGIDKPFEPFEYIYYTFLNILATSAFGKGFSMEDEEFKQFKYFLRDFGKEIGTKVLLWEFSSVMRLWDRKLVQKQQNVVESATITIKNKFISHYTDYNESIERDFCDALISAKNDALNENKESAPYLTDDNLAMAVFDMFVAGTDTSQQTFEWLLLLLCYYPEMQLRLREEIESVIGDRIPTHEDRSRCHYVMAFISETLRFRNVVPSGVFHSTVVTSKLGDYTIPKGTTVFVYQSAILIDEKYWQNPNQFKPERFLEAGKFSTTRPKANIPFGVGRRVCLGEKLAIADLFLVLVRFLQSTSDYDIVLHSHEGIEPNPDYPNSLNPNQHKIMFKKKLNKI